MSINKTDKPLPKGIKRMLDNYNLESNNATFLQTKELDVREDEIAKLFTTDNLMKVSEVFETTLSDVKDVSQLSNLKQGSLEKDKSKRKAKAERSKKVKRHYISGSEHDSQDRGHPKGRYKTGAVREILDQVEGMRVVPMYDMDPLSGGLTLLTPLEHKFVIAFVKTGNASTSVEIASSMDVEKKRKAKNWNRLGYELLQRPHVKQAIGIMQKKVCSAAALDATEIISNIREIGALALVSEKFDAALKAQVMLGEYLGIFGKTKEERMKGKGPNELGYTNIEVFKSGEDLVDNTNDIKKLSANLGINV